jgi:hypothetical protein
MLAEKERNFQPCLVSLEALVPQDNFYREVEAKLDLSFVQLKRNAPTVDQAGICAVRSLKSILIEQQVIVRPKLTRKLCANDKCGSSRCLAKPSNGTICKSFDGGGWSRSTFRDFSQRQDRTSSGY